jgi:hypothetical protein
VGRRRVGRGATHGIQLERALPARRLGGVADERRLSRRSIAARLRGGGSSNAAAEQEGEQQRDDVA